VSEHLLWVDLETTGLDPREDWILEIAAKITDTDLNTIDGRVWQVSVPDKDQLTSKMSRAVFDMHSRSGLLSDLLYDRTVWLSGVDNALHSLLSAPQYSPFGSKGWVLCGSSVHFDREFMRQMPRTFGLLSYRVIDVSTVKQLVRMWVPDKGVPETPEDQKAHRAAIDIDRSIEELAVYRKLILRG